MLQDAETTYRVEAEHSKEDTSERRTTGMESRPSWRRQSCNPTGRWGSLVGGICYLGCQGKSPPQEGPSLKTQNPLWGFRGGVIWRASPTGLCCTVDTHEKNLPWVLAEIAKKEGSSARGHQVLQEPSIGAHKDLTEIPSPLVSTPSRTTHY